MSQEEVIKDEPTLEAEIAEMNTESEENISASEQWASDSERIAQEGAPQDAPPADAELPPEPSEELVNAQAEIESLTRDRDARQQESDAAALESNARELAIEYAQTLVNNHGYSQEQASAQAESERKTYVLGQRLEQTEKRAQARELSYAAKELARIHGVPEASLTPYGTVEQMTAAATQLGPNAREIAKLKTEMVELKKGTIPAQPYSQQATRVAASSADRDLDDYNRGSRTEKALAAGKRAANP